MTWKTNDDVKYHYLKPSGSVPNPHGPLAESVSPSTIQEANKVLIIASTANNVTKTQCAKNGGMALNKE